MSLLKKLFSKKEGSCCEIKIVEVKETQEDCCTDKENCC